MITVFCLFNFILIGLMYVYVYTRCDCVNSSLISISTNSLVLFIENMLHFSLKFFYKINMKYPFFCIYYIRLSPGNHKPNSFNEN